MRERLEAHARGGSHHAHLEGAPRLVRVRVRVREGEGEGEG